jgi:hypothetical protein
MTTSTSQINFDNINAAYPVAGQDNDSQGFRDNFGAIKLALSTASNEITNIQLYSAKLADTSGNGVDNDFNSGSIQNAVLRNNFVRKFPTGSVVYELNPGEQTNYSVDCTYNYHVYTLSTNTTFQIQWPDTNAYPAADGNFSQIRMQVSYSQSPGLYATDRSDSTISIVGVTGGGGGGGVVKTDASNLVLPFAMTSNTTTYVMDCWTYDAGATTFVQMVGKFTQDTMT